MPLFWASESAESSHKSDDGSKESDDDDDDDGAVAAAGVGGVGGPPADIHFNNPENEDDVVDDEVAAASNAGELNAAVARGEDAAKDKRLPIFGNPNEVELALTDRAIRTHTRILFKNPDFGLTTVYGDPEPKVLETTAGRVVFNQIWPKALGFYNKVCGKKQLSDIIWRCYKASGQQTTVETLDRLKEMGFREATQAGVSIGINDMMIPKEKTQLLEKAYREVAEVAKQYRRGIITDGERKNKVQDIWTHTGEEIANALFRTLEYNDNKRDMNPVFMMVDSGARGNRTQVKQLAGMRGQMAKPSGEIIEQPITANFREGLTVLEYFISAHGARKGLADTALKTADSGYLTRKLVDAAQDVIITIDDCGTANGIVVRPIYEGDEEVVSLSTRIIGRTSCETVKDPITNKAIIKANQLVDEETAAALDKVGHEQLKIRSALTCESKRGICVHCYGRNLSTGGLIKLGEAVGINFISAHEKANVIAQLENCADQDYFERGLELAIEKNGIEMEPVDISDLFAVEVDFQADLDRANAGLK